MAPRARTHQVATKDQLRRSWIAARLAGVGVQGVAAWCDSRGLPSASQSTFERAVGEIRAESPLKGKRGRPGGPHPTHPAALWDWLLVDEPSLGVRKMIYRLPNDGMPQAGLIAAVGGLSGVRQILETGSDRELIIVALVHTDEAAHDLRARLEDLAPGRSVKMDPVEHEDHQPAIATWEFLATP